MQILHLDMLAKHTELLLLRSSFTCAVSVQYSGMTDGTSASREQPTLSLRVQSLEEGSYVLQHRWTRAVTEAEDGDNRPRIPTAVGREI